MLFYFYTFVECKINPVKKSPYKDIFEIFREPTRVALPAPHPYLINICIREPMTLYKPFRFKYSLFNLLTPYYNIQKPRYIRGISAISQRINQIICLFSIIEFLLLNIILNLYHNLRNIKLSSFVDMTKHSLILISVLSVSVPAVNYQNNLSNKDYFINANNVDSLVSIKSILYEYSPIFIFVCIICLLVALIGSAIFMRNREEKK